MVRPRVRVAMVLTATVTLTGACTSPGDAAKPPGTPAPHTFGGTQSLGALFRPGSTDHTCTASVIDSTARNLLVTAAHCISGTAQGYSFVPGYHGGVEPFGSWTVLR